MGDMTKEERKEFYEELGIEPRKVEEYPTEEREVTVIEEPEEEEGKEEERREEELERYRERTGY